MLTPPENAKVVELPTSTLWFDESGILYSVSKKVPQQSMEEAKQSIAEFDKLLGGKAVCWMADVTHSAETSREMRDWAAEVLPKYIKAIAMVSDSALGKMLANLFFTLKKQPYPTKMFRTEAEAKKWLMKYI